MSIWNSKTFLRIEWPRFPALGLSSQIQLKRNKILYSLWSVKILIVGKKQTLDWCPTHHETKQNVYLYRSLYCLEVSLSTIFPSYFLDGLSLLLEQTSFSVWLLFSEWTEQWPINCSVGSDFFRRQSLKYNSYQFFHQESSM